MKTPVHQGFHFGVGDANLIRWRRESAG
jgi:hypothetical protein